MSVDLASVLETIERLLLPVTLIVVVWSNTHASRYAHQKTRVSNAREINRDTFERLLLLGREDEFVPDGYPAPWWWHVREFILHLFGWQTFIGLYLFFTSDGVKQTVFIVTRQKSPTAAFNSARARLGVPDYLARTHDPAIKFRGDGYMAYVWPLALNPKTS